MSRTVDELTVRWEEDGVLKVKELDKAVLSSGAWATVAFLCQELDVATGQYKAPKVSLRRYRKRGDAYVVDKHLTLSSGAQATSLARALLGWFEDGGLGAHAGGALDEEG
jgi:hypothetical protein